MFCGVIDKGAHLWRDEFLARKNDGKTGLNASASAGGGFLLFGFSLLAGTPINEPIARMGPFVMNTRQERGQAYEDYMSGQLGVIRRAG